MNTDYEYRIVKKGKLVKLEISISSSFMSVIIRKNTGKILYKFLMLTVLPHYYVPGPSIRDKCIQIMIVGYLHRIRPTLILLWRAHAGKQKV